MQLVESFFFFKQKTAYEIVKSYWNAQHPGADFEAWWRRAVHDGTVPGTALPVKEVTVRGDALSARAGARKLAGKLEVIFRPNPTLYDGLLAIHLLLPHLPHP